jgi:hypothetical protein
MLITFRLKAVRSGIWFKALHRIDRALIDLTIKVTDNIKSKTLANSINTIINKLNLLSKNIHIRTTEKLGFILAKKLSTICQQWGNSSALKWVVDCSFVKYLAVMHLNENNFRS